MFAYGGCGAAKCVSDSMCVCVSLMTDNSSFEFGSVFVSDYTLVCLFGAVCARGREMEREKFVV